mgnify:CR=1 FL=1
MLKKILSLFRIKFSSFFYIFRNLIQYLKQFYWFSRNYANLSFRLALSDAYPCLSDNMPKHSLDPIYLLQNSWAFNLIVENKSSKHIDVGSSVQFLSLLARVVPTTYVDIRGLPFTIPDLKFKRGSILKLPFQSKSVMSISSICVIEHIGLGRYGDPLDTFGSEKAAVELQRVTKRNGIIYISVPVDSVSAVHFNAHRTFTRDHILSLFSDCKLLEEQYIYGSEIYNRYSKSRGFGTGLYEFKKK